MGYHNRSEETHMSIQTVGAAIIAQTVIKYAAYLALAWLCLSFADGWVIAWIGGAHD